MKKIIPTVLLTVIIDQIVKIIVISKMNLADSINIIKNFFRITYLQNTGGAFSILSGNVFILTIITLLILGFIIWMIKGDKYKTTFKLIIYGILLGGVLGNLIDRIRLNYVVDYLDFNLSSYHFPVFNIADICIVISVFILVLISIKEGDNSED